MTPLRRRMIEDLQLRGYSERTVEAYVHAVAQLARFYGQSPDQLSEEQIRRYLLHLTTVKKVARGTHTIALCGIKFFYERTVARDWNVLGVARPPKSRKLPVVLSRDEVWKIFGCVRMAVYRVCLITIYSCGLRLLDGARLQGRDGSLCGAARRHARAPARALAQPSRSAVALCCGPPRDSDSYRGGPSFHHWRCPIERHFAEL